MGVPWVIIHCSLGLSLININIYKPSILGYPHLWKPPYTLNIVHVQWKLIVQPFFLQDPCWFGARSWWYCEHPPITGARMFPSFDRGTDVRKNDMLCIYALKHTWGHKHFDGVNLSTHLLCKCMKESIFGYIWYMTGWWFEPLWKIWVRQLWWLFPIFLGK